VEEEMSIRKGLESRGIEILTECDYKNENKAISKFGTDRGLRMWRF
jgi:hypothetical protein